MNLLRSYVKSIVDEEIEKALMDYDSRVMALEVQNGDMVIVDGGMSDDDFMRLVDILRKMGAMNVAVVRADDVRLLRFE